MNNALFIQDELEDETNLERLRERDSQLVRLIEALDGLIGSKEWSTLQQLEFDGVLQSIDNRLRDESIKKEINLPAIYRLQGERTWARRFSKLEVLRQQYYQELIGIRELIPGDGAP